MKGVVLLDFYTKQIFGSRNVTAFPYQPISYPSSWQYHTKVSSTLEPSDSSDQTLSYSKPFTYTIVLLRMIPIMNLLIFHLYLNLLIFHISSISLICYQM